MIFTSNVIFSSNLFLLLTHSRKCDDSVLGVSWVAMGAMVYDLGIGFGICGCVRCRVVDPLFLKTIKAKLYEKTLYFTCFYHNS